MQFKYLIGTSGEVANSITRKQALQAFKDGATVTIVLKLMSGESKFVRMNPQALNNFRVKGISLNRMKIHCFIDAHRKLKNLLLNT